MKVAEDLLRKVSEEKQYRAMGVDPGAIDEEARTVRLAFSSEDQYERWFGVEILDHSPEAVRLDRYMREGAAFLVNHDTKDLVGVVEDVEISTDRRGRAVVRFGESARAEEIFRDIVNGIRRFVSVGYMVHKMVLESQSDEGPDVYRVTDWEPFEISTVPVPADPTVGIGKSLEDHIPVVPEETKETVMAEENTTPKAPEVDVKSIEANASKGGAQKERDRISEILAISKKHGHGDAAESFIRDGKTVDEFRIHVLESRGEMTPVKDSPEIGMTDKQVKQFSVIKMIRSMIDPTDHGLQEAAAFEIEASRAADKKAHRPARGKFIPADVLARKMVRGTQIGSRDITAGPGGTGQYTVDTMMMPLIEALHNQMLVRQLGATTFEGLVGDLAFPREGARSTTYWVGEGKDVTESDPGFNEVTMTPKTVGATSDLTRKVINQSSLDIENWLVGTLGRDLAIEGDRAAIHGSGSAHQPLGITNTTGIGNVAGGANGAAPTYSHMIALEKEVAIDNALRGRMAFLTNPKVRWILRDTYRNTTGGDIPIWSGGLDGELVGYNAFATNQVSSTLTKGNQSLSSAVILGNWEDLYLGFWGGLDINVDTSTLSKSGGIRVVALQDMDVALARVQSFAAMLDALTA